MTDAGDYTYAHDPEGNTTARFEDVDTDGTLSTGDTNVTEYEWDHRNRLTRVITRATEGGAATQEVQYTYDYLNRWVAHTVDLDGDGAAAATSEYFVYDATSVPLSPWERAGVRADEIGQIVLQLDETGNPTHRYLWGQAVDQILADETVDGGGTEDVLWPLTDHQNTVRDLAVYDEVLDETSVANHIAYDAFGNVLSETNAAVDHLFGYTGRPFDETTGLQNNLHRWYDAVVGRWLNEDPIGMEGGDANFYRYVHNEPTNGLDSSGLSDEPWWDSSGWWNWNPWAYNFPIGQRGIINWGTGVHAANSHTIQIDRQKRKAEREKAFRDPANADLKALQRTYLLSKAEAGRVGAFAEAGVNYTATVLGGGALRGGARVGLDDINWGKNFSKKARKHINQVRNRHGTVEQISKLRKGGEKRLQEIIRTRVGQHGGRATTYAGERAIAYEDGGVTYIFRESGEFWTILSND